MAGSFSTRTDPVFCTKVFGLPCTTTKFVPYTSPLGSCPFGIESNHITQIRDLRFTLQEEPKSRGDTFWFPYVRDQTQSAFAHPPISESDFLIETFVEKVDPFVKILHKPTLKLELKHFRRGVLVNSNEFQCRLFAIYALALLPMCTTLAEYRLHESKKVLLSRYRSYVEHGLSRLNLTTTQSLSSLQTFMLYIVSAERTAQSFASLLLSDTSFLDWGNAPCEHSVGSGVRHGQTNGPQS